MLGAVVAPLIAGAGLVGLSLFGLADAEVSARAQLEREARVRLQSVQSQWENRLISEGAVAEVLSSTLLPADSERPWVTASASVTSLSTQDAGAARLHLIAARADAGAGEYPRAMAQCQRAMTASNQLAGEALVLLAQVARIAEMEDFGPTFLEAAAPVPFQATYEDTSGRLLALLTAAPLLEAHELEQETAALVAALRSGRVALPRPSEDRAHRTAEGWQFAGDEWWTALETGCRQRLAPAASDWRRAFHVEARQLAAIGQAVDALHPGAIQGATTDRWTLHGDGDERLGARRTADGNVRVVFHTTAALDAALQSLLPEQDGYRVAALNPSLNPSLASPLTEPQPLAGLEEPLRIGHTRESDALQAFSFRWKALRGGLLGVAALLALAAFAAWRALAREARLRDLRSTFVASVSHDLRTPVASIGLLASNMASGYAAGSEEKYLDSIQGEAARLRRLVDDLLDFGRIERGLPPRIRREDVHVLPWIEAFAERERRRCHGHDCSLDLVTESLSATASLDANALERGLSNLIDNAIKHGRATSVTLRVRNVGDTLSFEVEDRGAGLSTAALRADLFQPFERGAAPAAGTGLGLSIVRAIAEGHDGRASLRAGDGGVGAIATIELPTHGGQAA